MIDCVKHRKIVLLGAGVAVVVANAGRANIISHLQPTPNPTFSTLRCYDPDDFGRTANESLWDNSSMAATGTGEPIDEHTGEPFDDALLYYEAQATTPLPVCMLGPDGAAARPPLVTERVFVTHGDPPSWGEVAT
jgi:hypothetical protein